MFSEVFLGVVIGIPLGRFLSFVLESMLLRFVKRALKDDKDEATP